MILTNLSNSIDTKKVSKIIATFNSKVLILQNKKNLYELPGGHIHHNETPLNGAKREFKEETGLNVYNLKQISSNRSRILYKGTLYTDNIKLSEEHKSYRFVTIKNLFKFPLSKWSQKDLAFLKNKPVVDTELDLEM